MFINMPGKTLGHANDSHIEFEVLPFTENSSQYQVVWVAFPYFLCWATGSMVGISTCKITARFSIGASHNLAESHSDERAKSFGGVCCNTKTVKLRIY